MPDPLRRSALAVLREGRCCVLRASCAPESDDPEQIEARVRSSCNPLRTYVIDRTPSGKWYCDCRNGLRGEACAHVAAVKLVTTEALP